MKKEIKMDYEEYKIMIQLIQVQKTQIEEFKQGENIVIVDKRYNYAPSKYD